MFYERISSNKRRTIFLMTFFVLFVVVIGAAISYLLRFGWVGLGIAAILALLLTVGSYWNSDKLVIALAGAKPADPVLYARLHNLVEAMAISAGIPKPKVYVVEDPAPNAFATGRNPQHASIAVTTGLLQIMSRVELEGVIAHEMSHIKNYDILVGTVAAVLAGTVVLASDFTLRLLWFGGGGRNRDSAGKNPIFLILALVALILAPLGAAAIRAAISRRRESLADFSAVQLTRYPPGLIGALEKLRDNPTVVQHHSNAIAHLYIESPEERERSWINRLFDTHPPLDERIEALKEL
jgi:heat shock protein HtpX